MASNDSPNVDGLNAASCATAFQRKTLSKKKTCSTDTGVLDLRDSRGLASRTLLRDRTKAMQTILGHNVYTAFRLRSTLLHERAHVWLKVLGRRKRH